MSPLSAPLYAAGVLLVVTGLVKLRHPQGAVLALLALGAGRLARPAAGVLAGGELVVGLSVLMVGGVVPGAASAAVYAGFTAVLVRSLRPGAPDLTTCGCTAATDTPPTSAHALLTGSAALVGLAAAVTGGVPGVRELDWSNPAETLTLLGFAGVIAWLGWAVIALLPRTVVRTPGAAAVEPPVRAGVQR